MRTSSIAVLTHYSWVGLAASFLGGVVFATALFRLGLVTGISAYLVLALYTMYPVTANPSAPHFGIGLLAVLAMVALAVYGWATALGGRTAFAKAHARACDHLPRDGRGASRDEDPFPV